jgi:hypothetical protein
MIQREWTVSADSLEDIMPPQPMGDTGIDKIPTPAYALMSATY